MADLPESSGSSTPAAAAEPPAVELDGFTGLPPRKAITIVGLGGSAGSLSPLQIFFSQMPPDSGMAFVVILHLSPEHESTMAEILQRSTRMAVTQVRERLPIEPNRVYVIPPGKHLSMLDGHLDVTAIEQPRGKRVAVDLFFRSLADLHGPDSIAIVLSGGDSDGAVGIKRVKERGGLTIAQDPQESQHSSMPQAAIGTGLVDWVLFSRDMPDRILEYRQNGMRLRLPPESAPAPERSPEESNLLDVIAVLRARTGRDFGNYKRGTLLRRIARRMQVNGVDTLAGYHAFLRRHPGETGALLQDLLISVTNFFRDHEAFAALEAAMPELFRGKGPADVVRVWVTACATGEEAYSIAMLLLEHADRLDAPPKLQIFASDIDESAVAAARAAHYPDTIAADVSEERLRRFFLRDPSGHRVSPALREIVLFAVHDVMRDAPFSRLDLVSCRNLLIYLNREAQARVFDTFHFALQPEALLFLGTSESADDAPDRFVAQDKKHRLYRRRPGQRAGLPLLPGVPMPVKLPPEGKASISAATASAGEGAPPPGTEVLSLSELHFKLVEALAPPSLVVDRDNRIVHLSPGVGRFLKFAGGQPTADLLAVAHPMLRLELRAALFQARDRDGPAEITGVSVDIDGETRTMDVTVRPAPAIAPDFLLVAFSERGPADQFSSAPGAMQSEGVVRSLERELDFTKEQLRSSKEQYGASNEEMKASNEELQAMNEELRSASEELETGREELQSVNEELVTVNQDLKLKVDELARSHGDLQNLMAATNVATVFLDLDLRVKRFTPPAVLLFNLISGDVGRPLSDLRHRLEFDTLLADAAEVLQTFRPIEREVMAANGHWYLAGVLPYRAPDERVTGVILTFVDISARKRSEDALRASEERMRGIVEQSVAGIAHAELDGRLTFANPQLTRMVGWPAEELLSRKLQELFEAEDADGVEAMIRRGDSGQIEKLLRRREGEPFWAHLSISALRDASGSPHSCIAVIVDIDSRKRTEQLLLEAKEVLGQRVSARTAELDAANRRLRGEIAKQQEAEAAQEDIRRAVAAAQESERGRISRELHDEIGQHLTALHLGLKALEKEWAPPPKVLATLQSLQGIAEGVGRDIHEVALELRPTSLDDLGLVRSLTAFLEGWAAWARVTVEFDHATLGDERLPAHVETAFYRVICEALHNVLKHAAATHVSVILQRLEDKVLAVVEDNGKGFDVAKAADPKQRQHLGLQGMKERAALIGGELTIDSAAGAGTTLIVRWPLPDNPIEKSRA